MRRARLIVAATLILAGALAVPLVGAQASSPEAGAPTAPYNVLTLDGGTGSYYQPVAGESDIVSGSALTVTPRDMEISFAGVFNGFYPQIRITESSGVRFVAGTTYATTDPGDSTHVGFSLADYQSCGVAGTMKVEEATYSTAPLTRDLLTAFAATYRVTCSGEVTPIIGELRYNSTIGYTAATSTIENFGTVNLGSSARATVTVTSLGSSADKFGAASLVDGSKGGFKVISDSCSNTTVGYGDSCTFVVSTTPVAAGVQHAFIKLPDGSASGAREIALTTTANFNYEGSYVANGPERILDTRKGIGAPKKALGAGGVIHLDTTSEYPSVEAVVLNVTVTGATANSFLTLYPSGMTRPNASNLNFAKGWTGANTVTVKVTSESTADTYKTGIDIYNNSGSTQVIVDVLGYYLGDELYAQGSGDYFPLDDEVRMLDTRDKGIASLKANQQITTYLDFGSANPHLRAFAVNITAVNATKPGFLTAWGGSGAPPTGSTLNFTPGATVSNFSIVQTTLCSAVIPKCAAEPAITIANVSAGSVNVIVDIFGVYDDSTIRGGLRLTPISPTRIVDTRNKTGLSGPVGSGATQTVTPPSSLIDGNTMALDMNLTAVSPSASTWLTVWPSGVSGVAKPGVSNLNPRPGQTVANDVMTEIGPTSKFNIFNEAGSTNVIFDVDGVFEYFPFLITDVGTGTSATTALRKPSTSALSPGAVGSSKPWSVVR